MKFWKNALITGASYTVLMIISKLVFGSPIDGPVIAAVVITGTFFGVGFTFFMKKFAERQMTTLVVELETGERLAKEGGANHLVGMEGVGGKLVLTDRRLIFKSHKFNLNNHLLAINLDNIATTEAGKSLKMLNNLLTIQLHDQVVHKFIVEDPQSWVKEMSAVAVQP